MCLRFLFCHFSFLIVNAVFDLTQPSGTNKSMTFLPCSVKCKHKVVTVMTTSEWPDKLIRPLRESSAVDSLVVVFNIGGEPVVCWVVLDQML